ncbi:putative porin [Flavobacteriaceae bacterium F08102]|nr:putative porin [Flavobacteriaceae bacterium F08102]
MTKYLFIIVVLFSSLVVKAQDERLRQDEYFKEIEQRRMDSLNNLRVDVQIDGKTHYTDYKIIDYKKDTTFVDTTLSITKDYLFNYLREDDFEQLPLHNQGQTYNSLGYSFRDVSLLPAMGNRAKHVNYYETNDINYYHVPTPTSELMYRTGLEQGQVLDAFLTFNMSKRHNLSLAYKGMRSLGKYRYSLTSHGNMRLTYSYQTKNKKYEMRSHITAQDLYNDENGGLTPVSIVNFEEKDPNFSDRGRLEVNFSETHSFLRGNRYYLDHDYKIWQRQDTIAFKSSYFKVGHILSYERKHYDFSQGTANSTFGSSFDSSISDEVHHITSDNQAYVALKSPIVLGEVKFNTGYHTYNHYYNSAAVINNAIIPSRIKGEAISAGGTWKTQLKKFNINVDASTLLTGPLNGSYIQASANYQQDSLFNFKGSFISNSRSPNFNFLLNQSAYYAYNWSNNLKNERIRTLAGDLKSEKLVDASFEITQIDNYTYFSDTTATVSQPRPLQADNTVNYLKLKVGKEIRFGKFGLYNTLMYQKVAQGSSVLRVPEFVTRNTFFFADHVFKGDPMYLQTGITFKYFTAYKANSYNPLLSEFTLQNEQKIGRYPVFDFFINAQIQRTRIYFKLEHINSGISAANYYSAPNYPYRDFVIRFGLVWNFFI